MSFLSCLFLAAVLLAPVASAVQAMTFRTVSSMVDGKTMIVAAEGVIEEGDAARFQATIEASPPDAPILAVTSPGGSVVGAMDLARETFKCNEETDKLLKTQDFSALNMRMCKFLCKFSEPPKPSAPGRATPPKERGRLAMQF